MTQGQRALHSCGVGVALALRRVLFALSCAAVMQFAAVSAQAQTPSADESTGASVSIPPNIPVKRDSVDATANDADTRWWMALAFIAGLVAWGVVVARRRGKLSSDKETWTPWRGLSAHVAQREIRRIASTRLTPRHSLHVIEWNGKQLLLGCTEQSVNLLSEAPAEPTATGSRTAADAPQPSEERS